MNETLKTLLERRSVRGYKDDLVPAEVLDQILEAGEYAPSGMGKQGTLMVVTPESGTGEETFCYECSSNGNDIGPVLWSTNRDHRICRQ